MSDDLDIEEFKEMAMRLNYPDYAIVPILKGEARGFVTWDANPPANCSYQAHKFSIIDAFALGACFMESRVIDEWLVLGAAASAVVSTLPQFILAEEEQRRKSTGSLIEIGMLGRWKVYAWPTLPDRCEFFVGYSDKFVRGVIMNSFLPNVPPERIE